MLAREEALLDEMLCGRRRAAEDDPLRHAHREHAARSDQVRACSWLMAHSSFRCHIPPPGGEGRACVLSTPPSGAGRRSRAEYSEAARECEGGAKTVKAAGDGGLPLTPCPLERWCEGVKACVRF